MTKTTVKEDVKKTPEAETVPEKQTEKPELTKTEAKEVRVIERIIENREIAPQDAFGKLTRPQVQLIKQTVAKGASDDELRLFIQVCKGANLNPFLRQVHLVPRWDSKMGKEVRTIQVGIDGFRAVAESSGQYAGNDDPIYEGEKTVSYGKDGKDIVQAPQSAKVTVHKLMNGERMPFTATARWEEYYPGPKMGFQWHIRPYLMLGKCAEALALRKAFPKLLSGMYAAEEMDKTASAETEAQRLQKGFEKLTAMVKSMTMHEAKEYKLKMEESDKYSEDQKAEFVEMVDKRIADLTEKVSSAE